MTYTVLFLSKLMKKYLIIMRKITNNINKKKRQKIKLRMSNLGTLDNLETGKKSFKKVN